MNYTSTQLFIFFSLVSLATILTRFLPFILFPENRKIPKYIKYLSDFLPYTIIGMLLVYCLKDISFSRAPYAIPETISLALLCALHIWKKNTFLSIGCGSLLYVILINFIFV
ncbi:branched-chain amino acid transporter permease [Herbinix luporum]|uniref:Putative membrane protein n=1 Tax=Herbinix luporum TaxID=1679721 RepID=A0A0K8J974_9FIRM|nr:AzlD domain-containing protein [Herbinix luporum]MDI9488249.1 AzlD domain-containing protein [Bacillota bacterium]CUH93862.1 putative membrane protein [Herbinix luporum]HHT57637.1 branched-chain amino acid transporter AzlD [Herbinix luporum]